MTHFKRTTALLIFAVLTAVTAWPQKQTSSSDDPVLQAMHTELERSKAQLKLGEMGVPYYIDYRVLDLDDFTAEATFGALRTNVHTHLRYLRVVVRLGSYKQDSFYGEGQGELDFMPLENDVVALRHQLWIATDKAYKAASEALTEKQARLKDLTIDQPVDDFAPSEPIKSLGPLTSLNVDPKPWIERLQKASAAFRSDAQLQSFDSSLQFQAINRYFINSEGSEVRDGRNSYVLTTSGSTQAADGMRLDRSWMYTADNAKDLPSEQEFLDLGPKLIGSLKDLRDAPLADETYHGPVLFSADAGSSIFSTFVGDNVLGVKPELGQPARTRGAWATNYKARVLPDFISVVDDPTLAAMDGKALLGHYDVDDEGVKAMKVSLVENGKLVNYLVGRTPIRDFPTSNGHGRARYPMNFPGPSLGTLIVKSSEPVPHDQLKKKLIELCQQRELPYCYFVETLGPRLSPRLLYRVWVKDGHEELVRGGLFGDLDTRTLRSNLIAAGDDMNVDNRVQAVPHTIVNPSILFDDLEVKRTNAVKAKLPEYPPPPLSSK